MKILHVSLGNPDSHQGGLNRYCKEVVETQKRLGHEVYVLYPGSFRDGSAVSIKRTNGTNYRINNALPVALTYGIDNPERYIMQVECIYYRAWLEGVRPDVIHVHSIQGIHLEFFEAAKELGIRIVFTTHDYYPICFKSTLFDANRKLCSGYSPEKCALCNQGSGLSKNKQRLMQSDFYQKIKTNKLIEKLKAQISNRMKRGNSKSVEMMIGNSIVVKDAENSFVELNKYYNDILDCFDIVHCNSYSTLEKYITVVTPQKCKVLPITHEGLVRSVHSREKKSHFNIGYMGGESAHKGYELFERALDCLAQDGIINWQACFYGGSFKKVSEKQGIRHYQGYFHSDQAEEVWSKIDILVAPSQCPETFGFIILEALCRGIPVIASDLYGSGYLLKDLDSRLIFDHSSADQLAKSLRWLMDGENYEFTCKAVNNMYLHIDMTEHVKELMNIYS